MNIPGESTFNHFITPTSPKFPKGISPECVKSVIFELGEESSRKQAELEVEAYCAPSKHAFLLLLRAVLSLIHI